MAIPEPACTADNEDEVGVKWLKVWAMLQVKSDLNHSVTIQVVDTCDSCAPDVITLLQPQWASISATTASNGKSIHYRQVL